MQLNPSKRPTARDKTYDVAVFDFDGTLADTVFVYPLVNKEVLRELEVPESEMAYMTTRFWIDNINTNRNHVDVVAYLIERHRLGDRTDPIGFRKLRQAVELEYLAGERDIAGLSPFREYANIAVTRDLRRLYENGARCFVVSHNYGCVVESALSAMDIEHMFEDCFCHCAYEEMKHPTYDRNQPKIASFKAILDKTGCDPSKAVVYDDLIQYVKDAISLGMDAVLVDDEHARPPKDSLGKQG